MRKEKEPSICYYLSRAGAHPRIKRQNHRKELNALTMPLHRFIVKPAFQFEIQFNSMARAIIYVDSTLIVYCFACALHVRVVRCVFSLFALLFRLLFTPERLYDSVKLAIVWQVLSKRRARTVPPTFSSISLASLPFAIPFRKYYFYSHWHTPAHRIQKKLVWFWDFNSKSHW